VYFGRGTLTELDDQCELSRIIILENVDFDVNKSTIKAESLPVLDAVNNIMRKFPQVLKVEVQGHTDSDGSARSNRCLSDRRAKACVSYLVEKGIDESRLSGKGFGEDTALVPNDSSENKAKNRWVEFHIIDKEGGVPGVQQEVDNPGE
jgi:OmpA-OmpF porin, OOP family